jgi:hypothetical protein
MSDTSEDQSSALASDVGDSLVAAENALRDLIESVLGGTADWIRASGLSVDRIGKIEARRQEEMASRGRGVAKVEDRVLYYSELYDLQTIIEKNWPRFASCLGDKRAFTSMFDRLEDFRNPDAHGLELLPFERHLAIGISGEIRNRVAIYRSGSGPTKEYFPHIESIRDQFGHVVSGSAQGQELVNTGIILHPGDEVVFELRAWDPGAVPFKWQFGFYPIGGDDIALEDGMFKWCVEDKHIGDRVQPLFVLISGRPYHRSGHFDDLGMFRYRVLPRD